MATVAGFKGIETLSKYDLKALQNTANWIGIETDWLAAVIKFESNFKTAIQNAAGSGATGLIQFLPSTAKNLGTSVEALAKMSFVQQLEYVKKYFAPYRGKLKSLEDTYLAVFYPRAIGLQSTDIVATAGSKVYDLNSGFDRDGKGYITKQDITSTIRSVMNQASNNPRIAIPLVTTVGLMALAGGAFGAYELYKIRKG